MAESCGHGRVDRYHGNGCLSLCCCSEDLNIIGARYLKVFTMMDASQSVNYVRHT